MDLLDLRSDQCRYALNDSLPYDFCGGPVAHRENGTGLPYCTSHALKCFDPKTPKSWKGIAGMIAAMETNVVSTRANGDGGISPGERVNPIDEVFANSRIGEKPLMERVL